MDEKWKRVRIHDVLRHKVGFGCGILDIDCEDASLYETNDYEIGKFYVPDIPYSYYAVWGNDIRYNPFRVAFIEYGKKGA